MEQDVTKNKKVELAFPKYEEEDQEYISKGRGEDLIKYLSTSMDEVTNWFHQYQVDSIELSISGAIETGGILRLVVSAKGSFKAKTKISPVFENIQSLISQKPTRISIDRKQEVVSSIFASCFYFSESPFISQ